ncbi:hypothetical protein [Candidatus Coxiella mudrowiae]|uniref:hypothetical protein n=1 Tax=Candidatus Coxiella mudrowiae TaxID=2054173 RepID=UPI0006622D7D|nr:hypothetical protein [Candidatus Coxiella mudrowiae]
MSRIPNTPDNAQLDQLNQEFSPVEIISNTYGQKILKMLNQLDVFTHFRFSSLFICFIPYFTEEELTEYVASQTKNKTQEEKELFFLFLVSSLKKKSTYATILKLLCLLITKIMYKKR